MAQEVDAGQRWAESKIKTLTGGDPVTARFMRQDFFTYDPQFKLWVSGNHKPGLRGVDVAIRERFNLLPFTVSFAAKPDRSLLDTLKAEAPGILRWAIEGCLEWQTGGLNPPAMVRAATDEYLASQDKIGRWIEDCCTLAAGNWCASDEVWRSYEAWARDHNEYIGTQRAFSDALAERPGITGGVRLRRIRGFQGIAVNIDHPTEPPPSYYGHR